MPNTYYQAWPALSADDFQKTSHLLFMGVQAIGKLMLTRPFEPHWANLAMPLTSRGITTGVIPYKNATFTVDIDFIDHNILISTSWGETGNLKLQSMSVADLVAKLFHILNQLGINIVINQTPQEVSNPINFNVDTCPRIYNEKTVNTWWKIMLSTYRVLQIFHSRFYGITPAIGLVWGTLDLRDARYKGLHLPPNKDMSNYISRNGMDDAQVEVGWSCSNEKYPYPAFFGFAYPFVLELEKEKLQPNGVKWIPAINEFVLDYELIQRSQTPDEDLLAFFESYYSAVAKLANWDPELIVSGKPI